MRRILSWSLGDTSSSSSSIQYRTLCSVLHTGLYASSPEPHECHGNGNGNGNGNGKKYGMMSSSAVMRPEEAGADTASLRLNTTTIDVLNKDCRRSCSAILTWVLEYVKISALP